MKMLRKPYERLISTALGKEPADLVIKNAQIINVFTLEIERGDVAISEGMIAGIGSYRGKEEIDIEGKYLAPAFIDAHIHPESTYLHPASYAQIAIPRGTLGIVSDLHEIANVAGLRGIRFFLKSLEGLPMDFFLMLPSCVPATPQENAGAKLDAHELKRASRWKQTKGVGEVMDFPGVLASNRQVMDKIALFEEGLIDGHAPGLHGTQLNAYISAGIYSDHETTQLEEGREKIRRGMYLMIREGSSEKNLESLLPLITDKTYPRCLLVIDDRSCLDLVKEGDLDAVVRKAIALGLDPLIALRLVTLNPAHYLGARRLGAIAPGYWGNLVVLSDIHRVSVERVFYRGKLVAENGKPLFVIPPVKLGKLGRTVNVKPFSIHDIALPACETFPAIEVIPHQIVTRKRLVSPLIREGVVVSDVRRDILKLVVVERHQATGNIGIGLVKGFGLKKGALASSVTHDSHNLIAVGVGDEDIYLALQELIRIQGGLVVAADGKVLQSLALPIGGLLSPEPAEKVASKLKDLEESAGGLGCELPSPFSALSFLALPVIPEIRLTDRGVVEIKAG